MVEPRWSTADFPTWNAQPASPWNYGLALDPAKAETAVKVTRSAITADPWVDPPVTLSVSATPLSGWKLDAPKDKPDQPRTPPLPSVEARPAGGPLEELVLVPYGSTHLRVTIFPNLPNPETAAS